MALNPAPSYVGRFAPSPTGDLHFGSLLAAISSFLQGRRHGGKWLLRIEDIDPPREVAGSARRIVADLAKIGMRPDEPVLFQSTRIASYRQACEQLLASGHAYWCACTRKSLPASGIYPGTCRAGISPGQKPRALRLRVPDEPVSFIDGLQGAQVEQLQRTSGDFVIQRADGLHAYQLAVVVDDAHQGVTEVVRGADLLDSTARQIWLQRCLGLPTPGYVHIPVATDSSGKKLSKSTGSDPWRLFAPAKALRMALGFLGHDAPELGLPDTWAWAIEHWSLEKVPRTQGVDVSGPAPPA